MNQFKRETGGLTEDELNLLLRNGEGIDENVEFKYHGYEDEGGTFKENNILSDGLEELLWQDKYHLTVGDFKLSMRDQFGGEGCGDSYWFVIRTENVNNGEVFFYQFSGWYASYQGYEIEDVNEVHENLVVKSIWSAKSQNPVAKETLQKAKEEVDKLD